jgi:hypothetical protein
MNWIAGLRIRVKHCEVGDAYPVAGFNSRMRAPFYLVTGKAAANRPLEPSFEVRVAYPVDGFAAETFAQKPVGGFWPATWLLDAGRLPVR